MHSCNGPSKQAVVYGPFGVIYCGPSSQKIASANSIANYMAAHHIRAGKKHGRYDGALSATRNVSIRRMCSLLVRSHMRAASSEFCVWRLRLEGRNWPRRYLTCWRRRRVIYKGRRLRLRRPPSRKWPSRHFWPGRRNRSLGRRGVKQTMGLKFIH